MLGRIVTPADVHAARAHLGWSIKQLAAASGVGVSSISGYESGKVNISVLTLVAICEAINLHSSDPTRGVSSNSEITQGAGADRGGDAICSRLDTACQLLQQILIALSARATEYPVPGLKASTDSDGVLVNLSTRVDNLERKLSPPLNPAKSLSLLITPPAPRYWSCRIHVDLVGHRHRLDAGLALLNKLADENPEGLVADRNLISGWPKNLLRLRRFPIAPETDQYLKLLAVQIGATTQETVNLALFVAAQSAPATLSVRE